MNWRVGDRRDIKVWSDPCLSRGITRRVTSVRGSHLISKSEELIYRPINKTTDTELVYQTFNIDDTEEILQILIHHHTSDLMVYISTRRALSLWSQHIKWQCIGQNAIQCMARHVSISSDSVQNVMVPSSTRQNVIDLMRMEGIVFFFFEVQVSVEWGQYGLSLKWSRSD